MAVYKLLSTKPDINEITAFAFYPQQGQNESCKKNMTDPAGYLCHVDHYEACAVDSLGCYPSTLPAQKCNSQTQLKFFKFMDCFEGKHGQDRLPGKDYPGPDWLNFLPTCASAAGLDQSKIKTCMNGPRIKALFTELKTYETKVDAMFLPDVRIGGKILKDYDDGLLKAICSHYTGTKPASCK
jgi:hypothetical protein